MNLTRLAVTRMQVTLTLLVCILVAGVLAYSNLPKAQDPGFTIGIVQIVTPFPGASPRRVEQLVSAPIEEELQQIPELSSIKSTSRNGLSIVIAEIDERIRDIAPVQADVRDAVDDVQGDLPADAMDSMVKTDVATVYGVVYALTYEGFSHTEAVRAAETVKDRFLLLSQASRVKLIGEQDRRIAIRFDHGRLAKMGLTPQMLAGLLSATNIVTPGGQLTVGDEVLSIEPSGSFESVEDVAATLIRLPDGALVSLSDVVSVEDELVTPSAPWAFYDGQPAVYIGVAQRSGGNSEVFGVEARDAARELQAGLPLGLELEELNFQPDDVQVKIDGFTSSLVQSIVIVFLVMMLFLGVRTGLIVASLIPTVICSTFFVMQLLGLGIDQMSLAALLIALGMLVDNAIVMAENIMVRMGRGADRVDAAVEAASELRTPLLISSLTTCAAFLPVYLAPGQASEFVGPIFKVVTIALLSSWVLAITTLPAICVLFLTTDAPSEADPYDTASYRRYRTAIRAALRYRWTSLAASVLFLGLGMYGMTQVRSAFFPPSEKPSFTVKLELPSGTDSPAALASLERLERFIDTELAPADGKVGVAHYGSVQGDKLPRFTLSYEGPDAASSSISMLVHTTERAGLEGLATQLESWVERELPGATVSASPLQMGPPTAAPIAVELTSTDEAALLAAVAQTQDWLRAQAGIRNVTDDWGPRTKKLAVDIDPGRARLAGVTNQDVAVSLLTSLSGVEATELREGDEAVPVELVAKGASGLDLVGLRNLTVFGQNTSVSLQQVASVDVVWDFGLIKRKNRRRAVKVTAYPTAGASADDGQAALQAWVTDQHWPTVDHEAAGELADAANASAKLMSTVPVVVMTILLLLMVQFNDVRKTAINLGVLPFSLTGVAVGLLLFDSYIGFITILAIISLFGIVLNNGNVLLDRIGIELELGRAPFDAVVEASVRRLRPILLTTATTVCGLIPLYIGGGPMFEPLAVVLMVGLVFGTALTLGLVPVLYAILFRVPDEGAADG
ncbi:MAG: multidrug efflux pump [Myxococcota bacterium]|jgi:multidrug efflux pump